MEIDDILKNLGISWEAILSKSRKQYLVWARMIIAKNLRDKGCFLSEIGAVLQKDHTSVIHYLYQFDGLMYLEEFKEFYKKSQGLPYKNPPEKIRLRRPNGYKKLLQDSQLTSNNLPLTTKENDTHHKPSAEATECAAEKTKFKRSKSRNGGTSYQRHKNEFGGAY